MIVSVCQHLMRSVTIILTTMVMEWSIVTIQIVCTIGFAIAEERRVPTTGGSGFEYNCSDGIDDDYDGYIDCDDSDCMYDSFCMSTSYEVCDDYFDNDGDGMVDCDDSDCMLDWDATVEEPLVQHQEVLDHVMIRVLMP